MTKAYIMLFLKKVLELLSGYGEYSNYVITEFYVLVFIVACVAVYVLCNLKKIKLTGALMILIPFIIPIVNFWIISPVLLSVNEEIDQIYQEAMRQAEEGNYEQALTNWEKVLDLKKGNAFYYAGYADTLFKVGKYDEAKDQYSLAIQFGDSAEYHDALGDVFFCENKYDQAYEEYSCARSIDPEVAKYGLNMCKASYAVGDYRQVCNDYEQNMIFLKDSSYSDDELYLTYVIYGKALDQVGRYEDAYLVLNRAYSIDSNSTDLCNWIKLENARKNLQTDPDNPALLNEVGNCLYYIKDYTRAYDLYAKAISLQDNPDYYYNISHNAYMMGDLDLSLKWLNKVRCSFPDHELCNNFFDLVAAEKKCSGDIYGADDLFDLAKACFEYGDNYRASELLSYLLDEFPENEEYEQCYELCKLDSDVDKNPGDYDMREKYANALFDAGFYSKSEDECLALIEANSLDVDVARYNNLLGCIYYNYGMDCPDRWYFDRSLDYFLLASSLNEQSELYNENVCLLREYINLYYAS